MPYDFSRLTPSQEWLLCLCGWHIGAKWPDGSMRPQPGKRTVRKLIERGLVVPREVRNVTEYDVPLAVHAAYCFRGAA